MLTVACKRGHPLPRTGFQVDEIFIETADNRRCYKCHLLYKKRTRCKKKLEAAQLSTEYTYWLKELINLYDEDWLKANGYYGTMKKALG